MSVFSDVVSDQSADWSVLPEELNYPRNLRPHVVTVYQVEVAISSATRQIVMFFSLIHHCRLFRGPGMPTSLRPYYKSMRS